MPDVLFQGLFDKYTISIPVSHFLICLLVSLVIGLFYTFIYSYKNSSSQSFVITLALLPAIVCTVIMLVNGNVGTGVAVAGAFSLVRFRSIPGTAKEISMLFLAMGTGLITGMGYIGYSFLFALILGLAFILFTRLGLVRIKPCREKILRITIPEDLDYNELFDDLFEKYTTHSDTISVKTSNMGSMFKLTYNITLKDPANEKEFIDALRCRNGNLEISISKQTTGSNEL